MIPNRLPDEAKRGLKLQLLHRFISLLFQPLIRTSNNGTVVNGVTFTLRLAMIVADQAEEGTLL